MQLSPEAVTLSGPDWTLDPQSALAPATRNPCRTPIKHVGALLSAAANPYPARALSRTFSPTQRVLWRTFSLPSAHSPVALYTCRSRPVCAGDSARPSGGSGDSARPSGDSARPSGGSGDSARPSGGSGDSARPSGDSARPSGGSGDSARPSGDSAGCHARAGQT